MKYASITCMLLANVYASDPNNEPMFAAPVISTKFALIVIKEDEAKNKFATAYALTTVKKREKIIDNLRLWDPEDENGYIASFINTVENMVPVTEEALNKRMEEEHDSPLPQSKSTECLFKRVKHEYVKGYKYHIDGARKSESLDRRKAAHQRLKTYGVMTKDMDEVLKNEIGNYKATLALIEEKTKL